MKKLFALDTGIELFGQSIAYYAIFIMLGLGVATLLGYREAKRIGVDTEKLLDGVLYTFPIAIIGARLYYVLFEFDQFGFDIVKIVGLDGGGLRGLAIHGGIIAAFIFVYFYTKIQNIDFLKAADLMAPGFLVAQSLGRWGNFINQEAHGPKTTYVFLKNTLKLPNFIVEQMYINGSYYHPTFLYESLWNIFGFLIIIFIRRTKLLQTGELLFFYLSWYGFGRFFIELLREDSLLIFGYKQNAIISVVLFISGIIGIIIKRRYFKRELYIENIEEDRRIL